MRKRFNFICLLLIFAILLQWVPVPVTAAEPSPLFEDSFAGGLNNWDLFGSTAWQIQGSGTEAQLKGTTTSTTPQRAVVKQSSLPYSTKDFSLEFTAKGDRFRTMFRYSSGTSYYFLEFKNSKFVELWKYPNSSANVQVGTPVDISAAIPSFNLTDWHQYQVEVKGSEYKLTVDGTVITSFTDSSLTAGGIGFSLKSIGPAVNLNVESVVVRPVSAPITFAIGHMPVTEVPYNTDLPVSFTLTDTGATAAAFIHFDYGDVTPEQVIQAAGNGNGSYSGTIPGTNQSDRIRYYITAQDEKGRNARYPESGKITVTIGEIVPYLNNFEGETLNAAPAGWTATGASTKVIQLPDGNKVFNLNGSGSAKLNLPMYRNADNFIVKFKAKYERTSMALQNTWRFRYRAVDDANNNAMEWATHNSKYFLMRKTTLGGNYYIANYVKSLLGDWHDYELRISGITHKLFIDGVETASGDDSDQLAMKKGYFQWSVVGGINLMIDDFAIEPIPVPYVMDLQPSGNFSGIYTKEESPGLTLALEAGAAAHEFRMDYSVRRADGDQAVVVSGTKTYSLGKYAKSVDTIPFVPGLNEIGTYEVSAEFTVDGVKKPEQLKQMRLAVVAKAAPIQQPDLDNESKFGLNTHYSLNWKDDIIDGARKLGARSHRSGIAWEEADKKVKDASGKPVYNYSGIDPQLNKLFSYGFNQITVLGIDKNANYQEGTVNTTSALKAMGDFVANTVSRYKGKIRQWEMPNEPEIFSKPYIPEEFVQLQKVAYLNLKKADPDAMLLAGDHTSSVRSVLPKELELGSFDYADAYSYHPYVYNSMPDGNLQSMMNGVKDLVNAYGGWKDYYLTEGGWPTATSGYPSVSEETQRDYIVRAFLNYMVTDQVKAYEYYNYKNDGTDERYYDIFWGITDNDGRPKLSYAAVNQLMTTLDKARYIGTWEPGDPDVAVQVFLNDGEPIITAWKKVDHKDNPTIKPPTSTITLPFSAAGLKIKDINGVEIPVTAVNGGIQLTVSGSPVYITGAPADFVFQSSAKLLKEKELEAAAKLNMARTPVNASLVDGDLAEMSRIYTQLEAVDGSGNRAVGLEQGIKDIYTLMAQIAAQIKNGSVVRATGYVALEALYNMAESASVNLAFSLHGTGANSLDYTEAVQAVTASFNNKKGDYSVMTISASAVLRMNRYGRLAEAAHARGDFAESYAYNLLAHEFAGAVEAIADSEPAKFIGVMANVVPTQVNGEAGYANTINLSLVNNTEIPQQVTVQLKLPDGWESSQTGLATTGLTIPAEGSLDQPYQVLVPENTRKGRYEIAVEIQYNGTVFDTKKVQLTVEDGLDVKLIPVKKTIEELDVLSVQLTGTSSFVKSGVVTVIGPDGVLLEPVNSNAFNGIKKGDKVQMDFRWTYHKPVPFNEYDVDLQVEEATSKKVIFHDPVLPVEFNLVQLARDVTVDGNLNDWKDAFPFHLRSKAQNSSGFHDPDNLEATAYAKWSDSGMYIAVSVRDNIHKQSENAANMWKNDSVQVSLDPLNNRDSPYGADDTEWGFALADDGTLLVNIFNSTQPNPNGDVSGRVPFKAVRDEAAGRTFYEFQIPTTYVKDLKPELGGIIGFNVAVNDADLQNGRDNFIQWTNGTADSKNTALYDAFMFIDYNPPIPVVNVSLEPKELLLRPGLEASLSAILTPVDATDKILFWSSSNPSVADVTNNGIIKAMSDGKSTVTVTTKDGGFKASTTVMVDGTAPVTIDDAVPGWHRTAQTVTLAVYDNLSGVAQTFYQLDDGPQTAGTTVTIAGDGIHTLFYNSTDRAGNAESPKMAVIKIDSSLPIIRVTGPLTVSQVTYGTLAIVTEDALSGVAETTYRLDGVPISNPYAIGPMSLAIGVHQLTIEAVDAAGNRATESLNLAITFTVEELDELLNYGYDRGWIDGQGILNSLLSKVRNVQKDTVKDNGEINFNPLLQEIKAQTGKKIDAGFALILQEDITYLIRH
ncbi:Ig-like domain-containing protein [Paenibacillus alginolyticus]|uniref:OmpL47-type beta-barrel domain-containing protein n=1 Tax=Paenibacillus alginolyticus TaxID=59839 RepID=UPI000421EA89|nr:sugar-binding protein [Paenibacillus alginolyticus]MCY9667087.1 Ig-like domain-containing protein [Paenibacillus alginolyticus]